MTWRKWFGLVLVAVLPLLLIPALTAAGPTPSTPPLQKIAPALRLKIEPLVLKELASGEKVTYIVHLTQQADLAPARRIKGKIPRRQAVASRLQAVAERSQRDIRAYLDQQQALGKVESYLPFWVFNGLAVTGDLDTLLALAARPEVKAIRANHVRHLPKPAMEPAPEPRAVEWNIAHVRADQVWREFGITGQGVVVANMDTGVDWTHPALQSKYRGADGNHDYNWFDFTGTYPDAPNDGHNHGTHTMGTLVGDDGSGNQIGMAPGARWIAVKIFNDDGSTTDLIIHQGFQWILAPTDLNGENPDPSKAPDVVNNSWGDMNGGDTTFWDDVAAWRAAGIFSPFAAGNEGEMGEGSMDSPGSFPHAVAVGATDRDDLLAYFSSLGPSFWEETKPEVSAPGVDIRSSIPGGYATGDGTSMAAPHAAGLAALLLEADPSLTVDDLENFMKFTALDLGEPGPDNAFGAGRIDAYDAVRWALDAGKLYGQVTASNVKRETSSVKGTGIPGATVNGVNQAGDRFVTTTDATGIYTVSVPYGFYDVTASAFGYLSATVKAVEVITDYMSMRDLALEPSPTGALSGQVTEAGTGEPLAATIRAVGTPALRAEPQGEASTVADASGHYTLTLPVGSYTVEVNLVGYQIQRATASISEGVVTTLNFALPTAPAILLVDADVVFEDNVANYYQRALDEAGYLYYTRLITDTAFIPTAEELGAYDVVIWANPWQSPGFIGADQALMSYLDHGGRLLIAGQDIGYWDGGGNPFQPDPIPFYTNYLHARYLGEPSIVDLLVGRDFLEGVTLALDDPLAYKNTGFCGVLACFYPDEMEPADEAATPIIAYPDGSIRGLKAEYPPYRVVYFGFGLESVGPRDMLARTVGEAISWLSLPSLNKEVDKETALSGEVLTYTLTLTNIGSVDLPGVSLTDPIPEHTSYMSDSVTGGATYDPVLDRIQWSGTLPALSQMTFTFQARIDSPLAGGTVISNTATFDDGQGHTLQASVTTTVVGPDLRGSAKTVDRALALAGDVLTYTITLHNSGPITASDVSLVDPIPDNATYVPDSVTGGATYNPALDQIEWRGDVPALEPGVGPYTWTDSDAPDGPSYEWVDITTIGTAIPDLGDDTITDPLPIGFSFPFYGDSFTTFRLCSNGFLSFTSTSTTYSNTSLPSGQEPFNLIAPFWDDLTFTTGGAAYYWTNNRDTLVVSYVGVPHFSSGGPYTFQVILRADGSITYQYQSMVERLEEATIGIQNADGTQGLTIAYDQAYVHDGLAVRITPPPPLVPPPAITFQVKITEPLPANTLITNTATIVEGPGISYQRTATTTVNAVDLTASTKTVDAPLPAPGEVLTYTIVLRNTGGGDAQVIVTDPLPERTAYVPDSATGGAIYNPTLDQIEWTGAVPAQAERALSFQVSLESPLPDGLVITNTATINDGLHPPFTRTVTTTVQSPDLGASVKRVDRTEALAGDTLTYTIALANTGSLTATEASLVDPIPENTVYVLESATGGATYNAALDQIEWRGVVPAARPPEPYTWLDSRTPGGPVYQWQEISATGTELTTGDNVDDGSLGPINIGFDFPFFGNVYTDTLYVGSNGYLSFGQGYSTIVRTSTLPDPALPNNDIMVFGGDMYITGGTTHIYYQRLENPTRLVVEFVDLDRYDPRGHYATFEVILYPNGEILTQYQSYESDYPPVAVGIENEDGTQGVSYGTDLANELAVKYIPPPPPPPPPVITFQVKITEPLPVNTAITNTATFDDGRGRAYVRRATTVVNTIHLESSTKEVDKAIATPGGLLTYTVTLRNEGNADAAGVTVTDPLPLHTTYQPGSATGGAVYDPALDQVQWTGTVPAGGQASFSFAVRIEAPLADGTVIENVATIDDGVQPPFTRTATTTIVAPDLGPSEKRVSSPPSFPPNPSTLLRAGVGGEEGGAVSPGQVLTYTILVKNGGSGPATAALTDTLPAGVVYVPGSAWAGSGGPAVYDAASHRLTWQGRVPPRGMATVRFAVRVTGQGAITNRVAINDGAGRVIERRVTTRGREYRLFFPLITKGY